MIAKLNNPEISPLKSNDKKGFSKKKIWIIEDEALTALHLKCLLEQEYTVTTLHDIPSIVNACAETNSLPDLVLADLRIGDKLLYSDEKIFSRLGKTKMIVLSAHDEVGIIDNCFAKGANDFMTKPIRTNELIAKVARMLADPKDDFGLNSDQFDNLKIDLIAQTLSNDIYQISLTPKEMKIIAFFIKKDDRQIRRTELINSIWGQKKVSDKTLDIHLFNLRLKLKKIDYEIIYQSGGYYKLVNARPCSKK
ncbi:MAG: response regulator transcription factor [Oligoflexales bacterium]|nr:response regulator transcription factor [Oligoflexales bacterium]